MSDGLRKQDLGSEGDALYAELVALHDGLEAEQSARLNARLVLLLMNKVGDPAAIRAAFSAASGALGK
jgi:hypothetical protein